MAVIFVWNFTMQTKQQIKNWHFILEKYYMTTATFLALEIS